MAGMAGASPISFDSFDGMDDDVAQRMKIPQKITVPGDEEEYPVKRSSGDAMTSSMAIPERIEIGNFASPNNDFPRDLRDQMVNVNSMSSMITPPRTLTVDDTKSAHYPQRMAVEQPSKIRTDRADPRSANASKFLDDESIAVGLEVIEEGNPIDSDSDMGHYAGSDLSDTGKFLIQVQQLNRRVRELERDLQRSTMGVWSKLAFFAFTIINPILLHWLFLKRR
ncbi:uncharacterized protein [Montipora foliosa]|uniref:uncharacterized protein n=1 Tax=Montipora foliosa TaxID=591990 RepID=UPI0035F10D69